MKLKRDFNRYSNRNRLPIRTKCGFEFPSLYGIYRSPGKARTCSFFDFDLMGYPVQAHYYKKNHSTSCVTGSRVIGKSWIWASQALRETHAGPASFINTVRRKIAFEWSRESPTLGPVFQRFSVRISLRPFLEAVTDTPSLVNSSEARIVAQKAHF